MRKFEGLKVNFDDTSSAKDIHNFVSYTQNRRTADYITNAWIHMNPRDRFNAYNNIVQDGVAAMAARKIGTKELEQITDENGMPRLVMPGETRSAFDHFRELRDDEVRSNIKKEFDALLGQTEGGSGHYGMDLGAQEAQKVGERDANGVLVRSHQAAILKNQTGAGAFPRFTQLKRMGAELAGARDISGKLDDFAYGNVTEGIFKPLVLMSVAYANHIALAELIPNALRLGVGQLVSGFYHTWMARLGYKYAAATSAGEQKALTGFLYSALGAIPHNDEKASVMAAVALMTEGHMITPGVAAGESLSNEFSVGMKVQHGFRDMFGRMPLRMKAHAKNFALLNQGALSDENFVREWQTAIREISRDPASRKAAEVYLGNMGVFSRLKAINVERDILGDEFKNVKWYHGTTHAWDGHAINHEQTGDPFDLLAGPGIYLTDSPKMAGSYIEKAMPIDEEEGAVLGAHGQDPWGEIPPGTTPHIYGFKGKETPIEDMHFLDMDTPPPNDVRDFLKTWSDDRLASREGADPSGAIADLREVLNNPEATMQDIHDAMKWAYSGFQGSEGAIHDLLLLTHDLHRRFGYDGFKYEGGQHIGSGVPHQARVIWQRPPEADAAAVEALHAPRLAAAKELQVHEDALQEIRDNIDQHGYEPIGAPGGHIGSMEHVAKVVNHRLARGHYTDDTEAVLKAHTQPHDGQFSFESLRALRDETIPRLQSQVGEAESRIAEGHAESEGYPLEVIAHHAVTGPERSQIHDAVSVQNLGRQDAIDMASLAAANHWRAQPASELEKYDRAASRSANKSTFDEGDAIGDWGQVIAHNVLAHSNERPEILNHIKNGTVPTTDELKKIPRSEWPENVKGRQVLVSGDSHVQRIAGLGFRRLLNPWVNIASRQPIFAAEMWKQWKVLKPMVDSGVIDYDEAMIKAMDISTNSMVRYIHNLHDRSQWSETVRNWMPFVFAQEQAYKRMGRLLASDPGAFRQYQLMITGIAHTAAAQKNSQGQGFFSFPGGTFIANGVTEGFASIGVPVVNVDAGGFDTTMSSANVIFPLSSSFRPDVSPIAAVAAKSIGALFPEMIPTLEGAVGQQTMSSAMLEQLVPNTFVNRIINTVRGEGDRAFASSMMQAMQLAMYKQNQAVEAWVKGGQKGPEPSLTNGKGFAPTPTEANNPTVMQQFVDRIKNQTRILYLTRAVLGFFSPTSPSVTVENLGFPTELQNDITKQGSVSKGMTKFLLDHPDATPYTVFQSKTTAGGSLPDSFPAESWINANMGLINQYPNAATYLMPPVSNTYNQAVYDEQIAQGVRTKRTPDAFARAMYVAGGNQVYYSAVAQHEQLLAEAGGNKAAVGAEYTRWTNEENALEQAMPIWAADAGPHSSTKQVQMQQTIVQLQAIQAAGKVPNNVNAKTVMSLLANYEQANQQYAAAGETLHYSHNQTVIRDQWKTYLDNIITEYPQYSSMIHAVFYDALGATEVNSGQNAA